MADDTLKPISIRAHDRLIARWFVSVLAGVFVLVIAYLFSLDGAVGWLGLWFFGPLLAWRVRELWPLLTPCRRRAYTRQTTRLHPLD